MPLKNTLTGADARLVDTAFALKQSAFRWATADEPSRRICSNECRGCTPAGSRYSARCLASAARPEAPTHMRRVGSTRASSRWARPAGSATRSTCGSSLSSRARCAGANLLTLTTYTFRSPGRSAANHSDGSASRFVARITERCIASGTRRVVEEDRNGSGQDRPKALERDAHEQKEWAVLHET